MTHRLFTSRWLEHAARPCLLLMALVLPASPALAESGLQLQRVVLIYRHGVRAPLNGEIQMDEASGKPWPRWPQAPGELTPHGAANVRLMGQHDRQRLAAAGLFSPHGCPDASQLSFWANTDQRTIASAQALAEGFAPHCPWQIGHQPEGSEDPLFHPIEARAVPWNAQDAVTSIVAQTGGPDALTAPHMAALQTMATVMGCDSHHRQGNCDPARWHDSLSAPSPLASMTLTGPIATTSGTAEVMLMAYAEGRPMSDVGWGRVTPAQLEQLSQLHALLFDIHARPDYMAKRIAAVMSHRVLHTLQDDSAPRLNVLVGSDNNIVAIASLLQLHFKMPGYAQDDPPIGGALGLELWRDTNSGREYVRVFYQAQSLDQLRKTSSAPPSTVTLTPDVCPVSRDGFCPLEAIARALDDVKTL